VSLKPSVFPMFDSVAKGRWRPSVAALACAALLAAGCTEPTPIAQDAGPSAPGVITPDSACPGEGCRDGATAGALRVGAAKRSITPSAYEVVNPAYIHAGNPESCDPDVPQVGPGHQHSISLTAEQRAAYLTDGELTVTTDSTHGHSHSITLIASGGTSSEVWRHSHTIAALAIVEGDSEPSTHWTLTARLPRCGELRDGYANFPGADCGLDALCEGDDGWPGADDGEGDNRADWFFDCGVDRVCPGNVAEAEGLQANGIDDDFDGVIDDGPYEGPDEGEGNGIYDGLWQAGFGSNNPTLAVHDPIWARCMAIERGDTLLALCSLDLIGFFFDDVEKVRALVGEAIGAAAPDHLTITATHTHEAPDSMGQWGAISNANDILPRVSGVNPAHMRLIREQTALAVADAVAALAPAKLRIATARSGYEGFFRDSRDPQVMDDTITLLQAVALDGGQTITTLFNWGNHPEILSDVNNKISSDFAHPLRRALEDGLDGQDGRPNLPGLGGIAIYLQGAVGGLMTQLGVDVFDFEGELTKRRSYASADAYGQKLAEIGLRTLAGDTVEELTEAVLTIKAKRLHMPVHNTQFHIALLFGLFDRAVVDYDREQNITAGDEDTPRNLPHAVTELNELRIGPLALITVPGEIFPELVVPGALQAPYPYTPSGRPIIGEDNVNPPDLSKGPSGPMLRELVAGVRHTMILGLGNDELGYIVPTYDFKLHDRAPYFDEAPGDHYEETNSVGPEFAPIVMETLRGLARFIWP
jgi:hypothetical protein